MPDTKPDVKTEELSLQCGIDPAGGPDSALWGLYVMDRASGEMRLVCSGRGDPKLLQRFKPLSLRIETPENKLEKVQPGA